MGICKPLPIGWRIESYRPVDRKRTFELLSFLPDLYPGGARWLERRLDDVEKGAAHCWLAKARAEVAGIVIDTPKGRRCHKLSTLYVSQKFLGHGIGAALYNRAHDLWVHSSVDNVHVTVPAFRRALIEPFLSRQLFSQTAAVHNRYGDARDELVYSLAI
jgi:GNAT superfamily N-acetyltransferase